MTYYIEPPSAAAGFGQGVGRGLSEQLPKEVERYRLQRGLKSVADNQEGLSLPQQFAKIAPYMADNPSMMHAFTELLKQQGISNAYGNWANEGNQTSRGQSQGKLDNYARNESAMLEQPEERSFQSRPSVESPNERIPSYRQKHEATKMPSDINKQLDRISTRGQPSDVNPYSPLLTPSGHFTEEEYAKSIRRNFQKTGNIQVAADQTAKEERARMERPELEQKRQERALLADKRAIGLLHDKLGLKLQEDIAKEGGKNLGGEAVSRISNKDITGEMVSELENIVRDRLQKNPRADINKVVDEVSKIGFDFVKSKNELNAKLLDRGIVPILNTDTLETIKHSQKSYRDMGRLEEFYNKLRTDPSEGGAGLTPQLAAVFAFPPSQALTKEIQQVPRWSPRYPESPAAPRASETKIASTFAKRVADTLTPQDSILSAVYGAKLRNKRFDEKTFFKTLRDDEAFYEKLTPRQKNELITGPSKLFDGWKDFSLAWHENFPEIQGAE